MSFWNGVKDVIGTVAPTIASALGGPLAGAAVSAMASALGLASDASNDTIKAAILDGRMTGDQLVALKQANLEFEQRMKELDIDLERIAADDRASARQREMTVRDWVPGTIAAVIVVGFFGVLGSLLAYGTPQNGGEALLVILGALSSGFASVLNYYFGSSSSSKQKNETISRAIAGK